MQGWRTAHERFTELSFAAHYRQAERCGIEIDGELCAWVRAQREVAITGENHQANLLACGNDLVIGLKVKC